MYSVRQWLRFIFVVVVVIYVYQIEAEFVEKSVLPALNGLDILKNNVLHLLLFISILLCFNTTQHGLWESHSQS